MVENIKRCIILSTINDSGYYESDEQVDEIIDSKEQVDARISLRIDSAEQVNALGGSNKLVDAKSNPKSDPISDPKVATYTTNRNQQKNY